MEPDMMPDFVSSIDDLMKEFSAIKENRDCISYRIFHKDFYRIASERTPQAAQVQLPARTDAVRSLLKLRSAVLDAVNRDARKYVWHKDPFNLVAIIERPNTDTVLDTDMDTVWDTDMGYLQGCIRYGENVEDEWFLVYLLFRLSRLASVGAWAGGDLAVQVMDQDGELLLIEASDFIPEWLSSVDKSLNRVWVRRGAVLLVPPEVEGALSLRAAAGHVFGFIGQAALPADCQIGSCIHQKLERYPGYGLASMYRCAAYVPAALARMLIAFPQSITTLLHAFIADNDMSDCSLFAEGKEGGATVPFYAPHDQLDGIEIMLCECFPGPAGAAAAAADSDLFAFMLVPVTMSKVLYSELVFHSEGFSFPAKYLKLQERCRAQCLERLPASCAMRPGTDKAVELGCKLVFACEVLWRLHEEARALRRDPVDDVWLDGFTPDATDRPDHALGAARAAGALRCVAAEPAGESAGGGEEWNEDGEFGRMGTGGGLTHRVVLSSWTDRLFQMQESQPHYGRYLVPPCAPHLLSEATLPQPSGGAVDAALLVDALLLHCDRERTHAAAGGSSADLIGELVAQARLECPAADADACASGGAQSRLSAEAHRAKVGCQCSAIANDRWLTVSPEEFEVHLESLARNLNAEAHREDAAAAMSQAEQVEAAAAVGACTPAAAAAKASEGTTAKPKPKRQSDEASPAVAPTESAPAPKKPYVTSSASAGAKPASEPRAPPAFTGADDAIIQRMSACLVPLEVDITKVMRCLQPDSGGEDADQSAAGQAGAAARSAGQKSKAGPLSDYFSDDSDSDGDSDGDSDLPPRNSFSAREGVSGCSVRTVLSPDRESAAPGVTLESDRDSDDSGSDSDDSGSDSDDLGLPEALEEEEEGEEGFMREYMERMNEELFSSTLRETFYFPSDAGAGEDNGEGSLGDAGSVTAEHSLGDVDLEYNFVRNVLEAREMAEEGAAAGAGGSVSGAAGPVMSGQVQDLLARMGVSLDE